MVFKKVKRRTFRQVFLPMFFSLLLALTLISIVVSQTFYNTFLQNSENLLLQKQKTIRLFLELIEETSMQFPETTEGFEEITLNLDAVAQTNQNILGTAYISPSGTLYTASRTSGYPSVEDLRQVDEIRTFMESTKSSCWLVRNSVIPAFYNNHRYSAENGVLTYIKKQNSGYLLIDIAPESLYSILELPRNSNIKNPAVLYKEKLILKPDYSDSEIESYRADLTATDSKVASVKIKHENSRLLCTEISNDIFVALDYSYDYVIADVLKAVLPMTVVILCFMAFAVVSSLLLTRTIANPLEKLYLKIQKEKNDSTIPE